MDQDEKRWRLACALAAVRFAEPKVECDDRGEITQAAEEVWLVVDAICAAEPKPAEAPSAELLDDLTHAADRAQELEARVAELIRAEEEARKAQREVAGWKARSLAAEADLTEAREIIAIMEEREVKREAQEADARTCAEWVSRFAVGRGVAPYIAAARRYLAGEPSPKAAPVPSPEDAPAPKVAVKCNTLTGCMALNEGERTAPCAYYCHRAPNPPSEPATKVPSLAPRSYICCVCNQTSNDVYYMCTPCKRSHATEPAPRTVQLDEFAAALRKDIAVELMPTMIHNDETTRAAYRRALKWLDQHVAEAAAAPKPKSAAMEQLREAVGRLNKYGTNASASSEVNQLHNAARAVLAEADGGR